MPPRKKPGTGEVWTADLNPAVGHEQAGVRPVLVISNHTFNDSPNGLLIIAPLTGTDRQIPAHLRIEAGIAGLSKTSFLLCDQVRTVSERRFLRRWGEMPEDILVEARRIFCRFIDAQHIY